MVIGGSPPHLYFFTALVLTYFNLPRIASCASFIASSCCLFRLAAWFRISSKRSFLDEIAPSTRAAAASDRLLKTPIATKESRVSTTRLFILATTGISLSSPSNPSAEIFFKTRSRRVVRFGLSSFDTAINPIYVISALYLRLRIAYLPYILFHELVLGVSSWILSVTLTHTILSACNSCSRSRL